LITATVLGNKDIERNRVGHKVSAICSLFALFLQGISDGFSIFFGEDD
jgi:hypothetical protein